MSNLTRYDLGGYDCGQTCTACGMEVSADGEYVKFDDIKELLNSSHNKQSTPCLHKFVIFETEVRCAECGAVYDRYVG